MLRRLTFFAFALTLAVGSSHRLAAQSPQEAASYNALLQEYLQVRRSLSAADRAKLDGMLGDVRASFGLSGMGGLEPISPRRSVGSLSSNPYLPGSTASPTAQYDLQSPANRYGTYGSPYSAQGARNPYATDGLRIYGNDGTYLGRLNANRCDPESVANPYGQYGSPYSSTSIRNPYSRFGSPYSSSSANNPYATSPPGLYAPPSAYTPTTGFPSLPTLPTLPRLPSFRPPGG
jgi:hypothetical protein